jgi:hypothetical protein
MIHQLVRSLKVSNRCRLSLVEVRKHKPEVFHQNSEKNRITLGLRMFSEDNSGSAQQTDRFRRQAFITNHLTVRRARPELITAVQILWSHGGECEDGFYTLHVTCDNLKARHISYSKHKMIDLTHRPSSEVPCFEKPDYVSTGNIEVIIM